MSFFNKKEEVLEIILTSYGKYKLSRGQWSPKYYAFFDEDVIYDSRYASVTEQSGSAEARIQEGSPSLRMQTNKMDLETKMKAVQAAKSRVDATGIANSNNLYSTFLLNSDARLAPYILPLGNSTLKTTAQTYAPAWDIVALKNEFSATTAFQNSSYENITQIPQLDVEIAYTTKIYTATDIEGAYSSAEQVRDELSHMQEAGSINLPSDGFLVTYFDDDSLLVIDDGYLVLKFEEKNSAKAVDQFSIQVWETESNPEIHGLDDTGKHMKPLKFIDYPEEIVNDILLDSGEVPKIDTTLIDDGFAEYFMDVLVDEEIDDKAVCNYIATTELSRINWSRVLSCGITGDLPGSVLYTNADTVALCEEDC
jgi:hypothetical protein